MAALCRLFATAASTGICASAARQGTAVFQSSGNGDTDREALGVLLAAGPSDCCTGGVLSGIYVRLPVWAYGSNAWLALPVCLYGQRDTLQHLLLMTKTGDAEFFFKLFQQP